MIHASPPLQALAAPLKKRCKSFKSGPRAGKQLWLDLLATTLAALRSAIAHLQQRAAALPDEEAAAPPAAAQREGSVEASADADHAPAPMGSEQAALEAAPAAGEGEASDKSDKCDRTDAPAAAAAAPQGEEPSGRAPRRKAAAAAVAAVEAEKGGALSRVGGTPPPATAREQLLQDVLSVLRHCYAFAKSSTFAGQAVMGVHEEPHTLARIVLPAASSKVEHACVGYVGVGCVGCVGCVSACDPHVSRLCAVRMSRLSMVLAYNLLSFQLVAYRGCLLSDTCAYPLAG